MGIRKPSLSVTEARRLANIHSDFPSLNDGRPEPIEPKAKISQAPVPAVPQASSSGSPLPEPLAYPASGRDRAKGPSEIKKPVTTRPRKELPPGSLSPPLMLPTSPLLAAVADHQIAKVEKVQVFVSALRPAPGVSAMFDMLQATYSPQKALQMIMRKALQDFDSSLESGEFLKYASVYDIDRAATDAPIQTSRMMPRTALTLARGHFDPLGLETSRAFGRKLATAALAAFFDRHR